MQSFISALTTDTCVFSRGFCHLWSCMECSRAFLCKQQHFSIWYGRNSNIRVYREPREHGPLPPHHSWEHTYKKRRWFVQVDLLNQRWSEPEPWAPMSRASLHFQRGWSYPHFRCPMEMFTFNENICVVGFKSVISFCVFFLLFLLESLVSIYLPLFALGIFYDLWLITYDCTYNPLILYQYLTAVLLSMPPPGLCDVVIRFTSV